MIRLPFSKKADIQISLSWLFMIIIGTFFIYVAYNVIATYSENENTKYYIEVKSALSNVLVKAGQTIGYEENYIQPIETFFKNSQVEIICNAGLPLLSLNGQIDDNVNFLKNTPTFMTTLNEGEVSFTYLAVENFKAPFKTTNMMAIVSKKNLIVFDLNSDITKLLREKFSESSYRDSLAFTEDDFTMLDSSRYNDMISEKSYSSIMFVSDEGKTLPSSFSLDDLKIDSYHLEVSGTIVDFKYGNLKYTDRNGLDYLYKYIDFRDDVFDSKPISMITMAIFSSPTTFECGQNLVIDTTLNVYNFYINKAEYLESVAEFTQVCSNDLWYPDSNDGSFQVEKYKEIKDELVRGRDEIFDHKFNNTQILYNHIENIQRISQELSDDSCEMLY